MRFKSLLALVLSVLIFSFFNLSAYALDESSDEEITTPVVVNIDVGIIYKGKNLIPLRIIFEELGATLRWDKKSKAIYINKGESNIELIVGSNYAKVNGESIALTSPVQIIDGKTFVPTRFIGEALGATVEWIQSSYNTVISMPDKILYVHSNPYFEINGEKFVYFGKLKNGLPNGEGIAVRGTYLYSGNTYFEGYWDNGIPDKVNSKKRILAEKAKLSMGITLEEFRTNYNKEYARLLELASESEVKIKYLKIPKFELSKGEYEDYFYYLLAPHISLSGTVNKDGHLQEITLMVSEPDDQLMTAEKYNEELEQIIQDIQLVFYCYIKAVTGDKSDILMDSVNKVIDEGYASVVIDKLKFDMYTDDSYVSYTFKSSNNKE